jgi:hypothetical protein
MKLKSIQYSQHNGSPDEWQLEGCTLSDINLIVGKNATGKTRTLNVIALLTHLLAGEKKPKYINGNFALVFENEGLEMSYCLNINDNKVRTEEFQRGEHKLFQRGEDGTGWAAVIRCFIDFQPPIDELAVVNRRDAIQHPFLEILYRKAARYFRFGTAMGQELEELNLKDFTQVIALFKKGKERLCATHYRGYAQNRVFA